MAMLDMHNPLVALTTAVVLALLAGCGGGSTSVADAQQGDTRDDSGSTDGWDGHEDVKDALSASCGGCHDLGASCWTSRASASSIRSAIASGSMPRGRTMSDADKATVLSWINGGGSCSGTEPAGGAQGIGATRGGPVAATPGAAR
jgi:hypothetical protein